MEGIESVEKRRLERFDLNIPAFIEFFGPGHSPAESGFTFLLSQDLSGNGGYFHTRLPLLVKTEVKIGLILEFKKSISAVMNGFALMEVKGRVVRSEDTGMAVNFSEDYKITPIEISRNGSRF